jgi:hypothetical protein
MHVDMRACVRAFLNVCVHTCMLAFLRAFVCVCVCVCVWRVCVCVTHIASYLRVYVSVVHNGWTSSKEDVHRCCNTYPPPPPHPHNQVREEGTPTLPVFNTFRGCR